MRTFGSHIRMQICKWRVQMRMCSGRFESECLVLNSEWLVVALESDVSTYKFKKST